MAFTATQRNNWIDLQMRKAQALAELEAVTYEESVDEIDTKLLDELSNLEQQLKSLKVDHTGMTRSEYVLAIETKKQEIVNLKDSISLIETSNKSKAEKMLEDFKKDKKQAEDAVQSIVDEEKDTFGFVANSRELLAHAEHQRQRI